MTQGLSKGLDNTERRAGQPRRLGNQDMMQTLSWACSHTFFSHVLFPTTFQGKSYFLHCYRWISFSKPMYPESSKAGIPFQIFMRLKSSFSTQYLWENLGEENISWFLPFERRNADYWDPQEPRSVWSWSTRLDSLWRLSLLAKFRFRESRPGGIGMKGTAQGIQSMVL